MRQTVIAEADRQLPHVGEIFLDHVGHFVSDAKAAAAALTRAGFAPTPTSIQSNPDGTPTGTGNITAMLERGYVEILFKTADTPLGQEFDASIRRHAGVHLVAFAIADAERDHARLTAAGFAMRPLVQFQRPVDTEAGPDVAGFTVVRVERGAMAEGRIQLLTHRTERTVWQPRWLSHPNGVCGLLDVVIVVADAEEAAARFQRLTGRRGMHASGTSTIALDRGRVVLLPGETMGALLPSVPQLPLPFVAAYALQVCSLDKAEEIMRQSGLAVERRGGVCVVPFPNEIGIGAWILAERADDLPWR